MYDSSGPRFAHTLQGLLSAPDVEFVRRNHAVGLHYAENLTLRPWAAVDDDVYLGVDARGRAFHVLKIEERGLLRNKDGSLSYKDGNIGYLLSGGRAMRALFLSDEGRLFGLDRSGRLLKYSPKAWARSAWPIIVRKTLAYYGATVLAAVATAEGSQGLTSDGFPGIDGVTWAVASFGAFASLLSWGAYALNHWERQNEMTDGFVPVGKTVGAVRSFDREGDDYRLNTETGVHSLRALIADSDWHADWTEDFRVQEKHKSLRRNMTVLASLSLNLTGLDWA